MICLDDVKAANCATGNACQNGAICVDTQLNTLVCICPPQWTGDLCDYPAGMAILISLKKKAFKIDFKVPLMPVQPIHVSMEESVQR